MKENDVVNRNSGPPLSQSMDGADGVYPSSEDTFLLIDALKKDDKFLQDRVGHYALCIEIGYVINHFVTIITKVVVLLRSNEATHA